MGLGLGLGLVGLGLGLPSAAPLPSTRRISSQPAKPEASCSSATSSSSVRGGPMVPSLLTSSRYVAQAEVSMPCTVDLVHGLAGGHEGASIALPSSIGACKPREGLARADAMTEVPP